MSEMERNDADIFHAVTMVEKSAWEKGYEQGAEEGKKKGFEDGFKLGIQKGAELGTEVGFYAGFAAYVLKVTKDDPTKSRLVKLCQNIITLAKVFSDIDPRDEALTDNLNKLQSKFKQLTSLLGVKVEYKGTSTGISF